MLTLDPSQQLPPKPEPKRLSLQTLPEHVGHLHLELLDEPRGEIFPAGHAALWKTQRTQPQVLIQ